MTSPPDALLAAAATIGARLCREAIWGGARCAWVGPDERVRPDGGTTVVQTASEPGLHSGTAGIALFLAELHVLTGEPLFRTTALGAAAHAESRLEAVRPDARLSLHEGWPGIALALDRVATALGEPGVGTRARAALASLDPPDGTPLDLMGGAAGAIPALLDLADEPLVALAVREGERLLATAEPAAAWSGAAIGEGEASLAAVAWSGAAIGEGEAPSVAVAWSGAAIGEGEASPPALGCSWATIGAGEPHLCGASHGASGIGVALLELAARTRDRRFLDAGRGAFAFESARFDAAAGGCPDLRPWTHGEDGRPAFPATWCHGSAGAALTRLRAAALDPAPHLLDEARAALATCRAAASDDPSDRDASLCHGAAGLGEALLAGGEALGDGALRDAALALGLRHAEALTRGEIPRSGLRTAAPASGLMLGEAGLGHHLLRLGAPGRVAGVLHLQPGSTARR
ncbi:MAG TPA: lanthionine synthetase LanC family protein [Solirubrobacteraceae bacterium]|nr:lanthionine synthetase LanC family protein [Solirubrobacteraceae bacterium]